MIEDHTAAASGETLKLSDRKLIVIVGLLFLIVYGATASYGYPHHIDPLSNAVTARFLAAEGSPDIGFDELADPIHRGNTSWFVSSRQGTVSQYPPGTALLAVPLYLIGDKSVRSVEMYGHRTEVPAVAYPVVNVVPATATAVIASAGAMTALFATLLGVLRRRQALIAIAVFGLGTSVWSVAADALWQHGPAMLWLSVGILGVAKERYWTSGLGFAFAVLTRPHTAAVAAVVGLTESYRTRSLKPALQIGSISLAGLFALLSYNYWLYGAISVSGGYGTAISENLTSQPVSNFASNLLGIWVSPDVGILIWSPFVLISIIGLRRGIREAPTWVTASAIGGLAYLLIQIRANRISGGSGFFAYRYPLEALLASAPLLAVSTFALLRERRELRTVAALMAIVSIALHAFGAVS